jgi:hypothetical protein
VTFRWLTLLVLRDRVAICRLDPESPLPPWLPASGFVSITRTDDELSIVCAEDRVPATVKSSRGWRALKVEGPLPFDLTGVLASIVSPLAEAEITLFAFATYDTDYVLVMDEKLEAAVAALTRAGHRVRIQGSA